MNPPDDFPDKKEDAMARSVEAVAEPDAGPRVGDSLVVRPGDSWTVVADRAGVDVAALVAANGGLMGAPLIVGEELTAP